MDRVLSILRGIEGVDVIDILAVSVLFYIIFVLLRESRSFTALRGLVIMIAFGVLVWILAKIVPLQATGKLLQESLTLTVILFAIIFQNELKKALTDFGQASIFAAFLTKERFDVDEIVKAVTRMSERKIGALIAIERRNSLKPYVDIGTPLDSLISAELIRTIFALQTPLHDGAIIIRNNRIAAAGCLLPLSANPRISKDLGTRHRAGIGLTEESDAVVIICSEETGTISIAHEGKIERNETVDTLKQKLKTLFEFTDEEDG